MFQNMLVTALTPLQNTEELNSWQNRPFSGTWPGNLAEPRVKRRYRTRFSDYQLIELETAYNARKFLDSDRRKKLSISLNIPESRIKVWFQNRRMKEKKLSPQTQIENSTANRVNASPSANCFNQIETKLSPPPNNCDYGQNPDAIPDSSSSPYPAYVSTAHLEIQAPIWPTYTPNYDNNGANYSYFGHSNSYNGNSQFFHTESELSYTTLN